MDVIKVEPESHEETSPDPLTSLNDHQLTGIEYEAHSPIPTFPIVKTEAKVSCISAVFCYYHV
jgi:hypothetical protein